MRKVLFLISALCVVLFITASVTAAGVTKHYKESIQKMTEEGRYSVEMLIQGKDLMMGVNKVDLLLHDKNDHDIPGAIFTVTPWMPSMGHGVREKPIITERGGGLYTADNIVISMTGHWELRISISGKAGDDKVVFDFPQVMAMGHEHMMEHGSDTGMDTSTTVFSEDRAFKVSYESSIQPVPINRIHSWNLHIETAEGKPVDGASLIVAGDMPEHGHGLPTNPETVEVDNKGNYRVNGMKFNMPGTWVVIFHIKAGDVSDSASFNLKLR